MQALLAAVRRACPPAVWSRGVELSRSGAVVGQRRSRDEIEVTVSTRGGLHSPVVTLWPAEAEWSCDCPSRDDACMHVAAAVIAVNLAEQAGESLPAPSSPVAKIVYRFGRVSGGLGLERFLVSPQQTRPLALSLMAVAKQADVRFVATPSDLTLEALLGPRGRGLLSRQTLQKVLATLVDCPEVELDGTQITVAQARPVMRARLEARPPGYFLSLVQDASIREVFANGAVLMGKTLRPIADMDLEGAEMGALRHGRYFGSDETLALVTEVLPKLRRHVTVDAPGVTLPEVARMPARLVFDTRRENDTLHVLPLLVYGDPPVARVDLGELRHLQGPIPWRDKAAEARLTQALERDLAMQVGHKTSVAGAAAVNLVQRLHAFTSRSNQASLQGTDHAQFFVAPSLKPQLRVDDHGFDLTFFSTLQSGIGHADTAAVMRAWQAGERMVSLLEGGWAPLPKAWLDKHGQRVLDLLAAKADAEKLPASALPDLAHLCDALNTPKPPALAQLQHALENFENLQDIQLPADLRADLRHYQRVGVNWMGFLRRTGMGAMLADDMGLGKTLQALCVVQGPALVVAPTSVLANWQQEAARFRSQLRVCLYHGAGRRLDSNADVVLTSYALLRLDQETLSAIPWQTVVLDEAQNIKNPESQVAQAAFTLRADFRITLTGTPVENRLDELWSQFHFLNRGLLGGRKDFQERYARPIAQGEPGAAARLRERIRPFILRRHKRDVAPELPPRTDVVLRCTLSDSERSVYDAIRAATMSDVVERLAAGGSVLAALEALLRLRQACCHPGLIPGQHAQTSAKVELLLEVLVQIVSEGHKALIFSQWTGLLDRVEPHLRHQDIAFVRLDGSTADRGKVVADFQADNGPPVMLVSLKAGGTGLNLTAADHVFLLDPWWNPAAEDQAADRAHRIGQQRPVLVHRLVAEDTVEERILALQGEKRAVAQAALEGADRGASLTRDDLLALLT